MKCPWCEHENPVDVKFCGQCAASLMAALASTTGDITS
jgi:hypothetical protein